MFALWGPDTAHVSPSPDSALGLPGLSGIAIALMVTSLIVVAWRRRKGTSGFRGSTGGAAVGNALMDFNSTFMPNHANAAVVLQLEEEELRDEAGEGPVPWTQPPPAREAPYRTDDGEWLN
ncbi:MAG: hypothetical protein ACE37F_06110 [Nannocystaceae bacterium]|nr:hypothetical protein [bacterium]